MDLKSLQSELDGKTFNPEDYDPDSLMRIDELLNRGSLTGYSSVNEIAKERAEGRVSLATESIISEQPTDPFQKNNNFLGLSDRDKFSLTGEVIAGTTSFLPNALFFGGDKQKMAEQDVNKAFRRDPMGLKKTPFADTTRKVANIAGKVLPGPLKIAKPILNIGANFAGLVEQGSKWTFFSQRGRQLASSWLRSGAGAGGGSLIYDVYNNQKKEEFAALNKDVIPFEQIAATSFDKLSTRDQMTQLALEKARDSLFWNGAFITGIPLAGQSFKNAAKWFTGTNTDKAVEIGRRAEAIGLPLDIVSLADESKGLGSFTKTYFKTVGVLPFVSMAQKKRTAEFGLQAKSRFNSMFVEQLAPITHSELLGAVTPSILRQNYGRKKNLIDVAYSQAELAAQKMGNPAYIPTVNISTKAADFLNSEQSIESISRYLSDNNIGTEPINRLFSRLKDVGDQADQLPKSITPLQYKGLQESLNEVMNLLPMDNASLQPLRNIKLALENDLNSLIDPKIKDAVFLDSTFKNKFDSIIESQGKEAANDFLRKFSDDIGEFNLHLGNANRQFSLLQQTKASNVLESMRNIDDVAFSEKSLVHGIGMPGKGISPETFYDGVMKKIMLEGSGTDLMLLRQTLGAVKGKDNFAPGAEFFDRLASRTLFDAFFMAHANPSSVPIKTLGESMKQLRDKGIVSTPWWDEAAQKIQNGENPFDYKNLGTPRLDNAGKEIFDEDLVQRMGRDVTDVDTSQYLDINYEDLGSFDAEEFLKGLGVTPGRAGFNTLENKRSALTQILGGGQKGAENFKNLKDFADMISIQYQVPLGNTSTFVARRIQLSGFDQFKAAGAAGVASGVGVGAFFAGIPGVVIPLYLLHYIGKIFTDPKKAKALLDLATPDENLKNMSKQVFGRKMQTKRQAFATILQHMIDEDPEDFPVADLKKITEEQLVNYLLNKKIKIPNTNINEELVPPKERQFMFPVKHELKKLPPQKRREVQEYLAATQKKAFESYQEFGPIAQSYLDASYTGKTDTSANTMQAADTPAPVEPPKTTAPSLNMTGSTMQSAAQNTSFESLFPQDSLGTLIANKKNNKGT